MLDDLLKEFKEYLMIDEDDDTQDDFLKGILLAGEAFINSYYCVAIFEKEETDRLSPIYGDKILYTKKGRIFDITHFTYNGEDNDDNISDLLFENNKIILSDNYSLKSKDRVVITYKVGYSDIADIPQGLKSGLYAISKKLYTDATKNSDLYTHTDANVGGNVKFKIEDIPVMADILLSSYKVYRL